MSGTSTPQESRSPPPPGEGGAGQQQQSQQQPGFNAATLARRFVRQYYQNLMTTPDQVHKFYQPTSLLTDGFGNVDTQPLAFDAVYQGDSDNLKTRFYQNDFSITVELEEGAIDAQLSVNGGVLIVVTGHVFYTPNTSEDEDAAVDDPYRKRFVHTIFLNLHTVGSKKLFYIHNDILRFFKDVPDASGQAAVAKEAHSDGVVEPSLGAFADAAGVAEPTLPTTSLEEPIIAAPETLAPVLETTTTTTIVAEEPKAKEDVVTESPAAAMSVEASLEDEAPGGGVEETKDELPTPVSSPSKPNRSAKKDTTNKAGASSPKSGKADGDAAAASGKAAHQNKKTPVKELAEVATTAVTADAAPKSPVPPPSPAPKPPPGSWASLVAGAGGAVSSAAHPVKAAPSSATKPPPSKPPTVPTTEKPSTPSAAGNDKRDAAAASGTSNASGGAGNQNAASNNNNNNASGNNNSNNTTGGGVNNHKMGSNNNNNIRPPKRDPDCTLVIKNLPDNTKEAEVRAVFETFATQTKSSIVGITVAAHRGIAFVDFDSITPVLKAVDQHKEDPLRLQGRTLEVDQKTAEQRARRAAHGRGNFRSGSPGHTSNNNNSNNANNSSSNNNANGGANRFGGGSGGGGRGGHRRREGGRGDRGGMGGGGRGGRGGR